MKYVKEQTEEICLAAVQQNGHALKDVKKQTEKICLAAVQQDGGALKYAKEQTEKIYLSAVWNNRSASIFASPKHVKEQTAKQIEDICVASVRRYGGSSEYLASDLYCKSKKEYLSNDFFSPYKQYVQEQTEKLCLATIQNSGNRKCYVKGRVKEIYDDQQTNWSFV